MFKKNKNKDKGFTLIETLIAISILMISVAAPLTLAAKGIQAANLAKQQIVAYYLAQDTYEILKNIIDSNKLENYTYSEGGMIHGDLRDKCVSDKCRIDTITKKISIYHSGDKLKFSPGNSVYGFDSTGIADYENSQYERYFKISKIEDNGLSIDEIKISVTIKWNIPYGGEQEYTLNGNVTNW